MSDYTVKVLLEALDRPSTLKALTRKTDLRTHQVLSAIIEARVKGHRIAARGRGDVVTQEPTYYEVIRG